MSSLKICYVWKGWLSLQFPVHLERHIDGPGPGWEDLSWVRFCYYKFSNAWIIGQDEWKARAVQAKAHYLRLSRFVKYNQPVPFTWPRLHHSLIIYSEMCRSLGKKWCPLAAWGGCLDVEGTSFQEKASSSLHKNFDGNVGIPNLTPLPLVSFVLMEEC